MKLNHTLGILAVAALMTACGGAQKEEVAAAAEEQPEAAPAPTTASYAVNAESSSVEWSGSKSFTDGMHTGTIGIANGSLSMTGENLEAGSFTINMGSIAEASDNAEMAAKLVGHLSSPDFFDVATFPEASFAITAVEASAEEGATHNISGNLTIKGESKNITFPANVSMNGDDLNATAEFTIDRTQWGVVYGSGSLPDMVKDNIISDEIGIKINLVANKS